MVWSEPAGDVQAGKLELEPTALRLEGSLSTRTPFVHRVYFEDIESVRVGRENGDRLAGKPSLILQLAVGGPLRIGSVDGIGRLAELAERLGRLTATRLAV